MKVGNISRAEVGVVTSAPLADAHDWRRRLCQLGTFDMILNLSQERISFALRLRLRYDDRIEAEERRDFLDRASWTLHALPVQSDLGKREKDCCTVTLT